MKNRSKSHVSVRTGDIHRVHGAVLFRTQHAVPAGGTRDSGVGRGRGAERVERAGALHLSGAPTGSGTGHQWHCGIGRSGGRADIGRAGPVGCPLAVDLRGRLSVGSAVTAARSALAPGPASARCAVRCAGRGAVCVDLWSGDLWS